MKKLIIAAAAMTLLLASVSAYACGGKNNSGKAENSAAKAQLTSSSVEANRNQAQDVSSNSEVKTMTTEARTVDGAAVCPYMKGMYEEGAAMKTDAHDGCGASAKTTEWKNTGASSDCPVKPGCCDSKATKASSASQKAEVKEEKTTATPVLIMSDPLESAGSQQ